MASIDLPNTARPTQMQTQTPQGHSHQRSMSSVLKSFVHHRRAESDAPVFAKPDLPRISTQRNVDEIFWPPDYSRPPPALGEIPMNRQGGIMSQPVSRQPSRQFEPLAPPRAPMLSSHKTFSSISLQSQAMRDAERLARQKQKENASPTRPPKKTKSASNLAALLGRPKSSKNLNKQVKDAEVRSKKDKENTTPPPTALTAQQEDLRSPIYAQFASGALERQNELDMIRKLNGNDYHAPWVDPSTAGSKKARPQSFQSYRSKHDSHQVSAGQPTYSSVKVSSPSKKGSPSKIQKSLRGLRGGHTSKPEPTSGEPSELVLDPKDIDKHLEAMLDRRNIPENQRYKMRNLADTIKMEFIRQDWAESQAKLTRPNTNDSDSSINEGQDKDCPKESKAKRSKHRSFTLSRSFGKKSEPNTPSKKSKGEFTLGRHLRSKSTESIVGDSRPSSSGSASSGGILSKIKAQMGPADFVTYLRKVQKPELVEVGKLHKLRLLLRNETVAWTDDFVRQGGMEEIVGLLHRIMEIEWREEHEDALLHENLLCLKALCTTALAMQYLHSIQATLFPALLFLIFDPEKKGPSEFTTRNIITSVLFTYIQSAPPEDRLIRARTILGYLRDPEPKEDDRPVDWMVGMHRDRPYRVWCKEAVSVTKEVFWIFLHHLNVVFLPREMEQAASSKDSLAYAQAHFPQERPPVPAAPYVGGVEWDATNYLASHLDLMNSIIACTPTRDERNVLRGQLRISGWERCMGGSLRLCKEKFYPCVHDALRTWVAAAAEDGWDVRDVRYGPPAETRSPPKKAGGAKKKDEPAPKIEIPKLDFGLDTPALARPPAIGVGMSAARGSENWLS